MNYELAYRVGFHPWEDAGDQPQFVAKIAALLADEERPGEQPYGPALDLGTGSGIWAVQLARRGWRVTGIDLVEKALGRARTRAQSAGVEVRLVKASVTELGGAGVGSDFRLVLDTGTFHGLDRAEREAMGREVSAVTTDDATVLLLAWTPRRRGPMPRGASREDLEEAFPGWTVTDAGDSCFEAPKPVQLLLKPGERWYRLRRR
jgi:cyclopropane fatty-acyl-phospholipid synthase-like methyltransferase